MSLHRFVTLTFLAVFTVLLAAAPGPLFAQEDAQRCEGTVTDEQGAPLQGVTITFRDKTTNRMAQPVKTNKKGRYAHNVLRSNTSDGWEIRAELDGYKMVQITALSVSSGGGRVTNETYMVGIDQAVRSVRVPPQARSDVSSKGKCVVDFVMTAEDHYNEVFRELNQKTGGEAAAQQGEEPGGNEAPGAPAEQPAAPAAKPFDIGLQHIRDGDYAGAVGPFREAVEDDPDDAAAHFRLGEALLKTDDVAGAEPELKKALAMDPTLVGLNFDMGMLYIKKSRLMQAIPYFEKERELVPDSDALLQNLAKAYVDTEQYDKAVPIDEHLIELDPSNIEFYGALAGVYKELGDPAKELEVYQRMGDQDPSGMAFYNLGNLMFNKNEMQKAADAYTKAIAAAPGNAGAHYQLGMAYVNLAKFPEAVKELEKFVELKPKDSEGGRGEEHGGRAEEDGRLGRHRGQQPHPSRRSAVPPVRVKPAGSAEGAQTRRGEPLCADPGRTCLQPVGLHKVQTGGPVLVAPHDPRQIGARGCERVDHLGAHPVAAGAGAGACRDQHPFRVGPELVLERGQRREQHAGARPAPTGMDHRESSGHRIVRRERHAVGDRHAEGEPSAVCQQGVALAGEAVRIQ